MISSIEAKVDAITPPERADPVSLPHSPRLGARTTLRALRHRNFQLFFSGQMISLTGTWMQNIAQDWLVYRLTGSSLLLGAVAFMNLIPVLVLAPIAGIVADRFNRHRTVILTQTLAMILGLILAVLTLSGLIRVWQIMILTTLLGTVLAFDIPARQAFLMDMVGRDDLFNAIALNSSMFNAARIIGPAFAGALVAWIGEGWCFFANGVSYIAVIGGLSMMRLGPQISHLHSGSAFDHIVEGFRFARSKAPVHLLLLMVGMASLVAMPYTVLMPIFADSILHGGARGLGLLMGATGVGALLGSLTLASKQDVRGLGRWVWVASFMFGGSLILFSLSRHFWLSFALLVPAGFGMMVQMGASNTLLQVMSPDRLRGRVLSLYSMMFIGMSPIGALLGGALAARIGAPLTIGLGGTACLTGAVAFARRLPSIRGEARELIRAQGIVLGEPPAPFSILTRLRKLTRRTETD
jgi:MFS family permease